MEVTVKYKLYDIRNNKKITDRQLADMVGISKSTINNIENNRTNTSILILCQIAAALEVKPEELYEYYVKT